MSANTATMGINTRCRFFWLFCDLHVILNLKLQWSCSMWPKVPAAVENVVASFLPMADAMAWQRTCRRFRARFVIVKIIHRPRRRISIAVCRNECVVELGGRFHRDPKIRCSVQILGAKQLQLGGLDACGRYTSADAMFETRFRVVRLATLKQLVCFSTKRSLMNDLPDVLASENLVSCTISGSYFVLASPLTGPAAYALAPRLRAFSCPWVSWSLLGAAKFPSLRILNLTCSDIKDVTPLCGLDTLETLSLEGTLITEMSTPGGTCAALVRLPALSSLNLMRTHVNDGATLARKRWKTLAIYMTEIDISPLEKADIETLIAGNCVTPVNIAGDMFKTTHFRESSIDHELHDTFGVTFSFTRRLVMGNNLSPRESCSICYGDCTFFFSRATRPAVVILFGVTNLHLDGVNFPRMLAPFLTSLSLANVDKFNAAVIACGAPGLQSLSIENVSVNTPDLTGLSNLSLRHLTLRGFAARRVGFESLVSLRTLVLMNGFEPFPFEIVCALPNLHTAEFDKVHVRGGGSGHQGQSALRVLRFYRGNLEGEIDLATLAPALRTLEVRVCLVTASSQGLEHPTLAYFDTRNSIVNRKWMRVRPDCVIIRDEISKRKELR
jgi:hypothetical protein